MENNLPPVLPTSGHTPGAPQVSIRRNAADVSISKTQQQKDREAASVSMNQVISGKPSNTPTTSMYRAIHGDSDATTSVTHQNEAKHSVYEGETKEEEDARDYRRFSYIRRMIKARQAEEKKVEKEEAEHHGFEAGIGKTHRSSGATGFERRFHHYLKENRATYKNLSGKDAELLGGIVEKHLKVKRTGSEINRMDRKRMAKEAYKHYKTGTISKDDYKDFKKFVGQLE